MESAKIPLNIVWAIYDVKVETAKNGFFHFEGSRESIFLGLDCDFEVGDEIKISFERTKRAKSAPTSK